MQEFLLHGAYWLLTRVGEAGETDWYAGGTRGASLRAERRLRIVRPHQLGLYEFKCTVPGHERMKGVIEVVV